MAKATSSFSSSSLPQSLSFTVLGDGSSGCGLSGLLTQHRAASIYSIEEVVLGHCLVNAGDSVMRVCQDAKAKLSRLSLVIITSLAPHCTAGLASVLLSLSGLGVAAVTIVGPEGLDQYLRHMQLFVNRKYPVVNVREVSMEHSPQSPLCLKLPDWTVTCFGISANKKSSISMCCMITTGATSPSMIEFSPETAIYIAPTTSLFSLYPKDYLAMAIQLSNKGSASHRNTPSSSSSILLDFPISCDGSPYNPSSKDNSTSHSSRVLRPAGIPVLKFGLDLSSSRYELRTPMVNIAKLGRLFPQFFPETPLNIDDVVFEGQFKLKTECFELNSRGSHSHSNSNCNSSSNSNSNSHSNSNSNNNILVPAPQVRKKAVRNVMPARCNLTIVLQTSGVQQTVESGDGKYDDNDDDDNDGDSNYSSSDEDEDCASSSSSSNSGSEDMDEGRGDKPNRATMAYVKSCDMMQYLERRVLSFLDTCADPSFAGVDADNGIETIGEVAAATVDIKQRGEKSSQCAVKPPPPPLPPPPPYLSLSSTYATLPFFQSNTIDSTNFAYLVGQMMQRVLDELHPEGSSVPLLELQVANPTLYSGVREMALSRIAPPPPPPPPPPPHLSFDGQGSKRFKIASSSSSSVENRSGYPATLIPISNPNPNPNPNRNPNPTPILTASAYTSTSSVSLPDDIRIRFLGTGSAAPSKHRNSSSIMIQTLMADVAGKVSSRVYDNKEEEGPIYDRFSSILLDIGEGTVTQIFFSCRCNAELFRETLLSISVVWISHHHADHICGLMNLLEHVYRARRWLRSNSKGSSSNSTKSKSRSSSGLPDVVTVIAPAPLLHYFEYAVAVAGLDDIVRFKLTTESLYAGMTSSISLASSGCVVKLTSVPVFHCKDSYAVVMQLRNGLTIAYSGDCRPSGNFIKAGRGCDLLIHEATFDDSRGTDALAKSHSTVSEALLVAQQMRAKHTILSHFSQRYPGAMVLNPDLSTNLYPDSSSNNQDFGRLNNESSHPSYNSTSFSPSSSSLSSSSSSSSASLSSSLPIPPAFDDFAVAFDFIGLAFPSEIARFKRASQEICRILQLVEAREASGASDNAN